MTCERVLFADNQEIIQSVRRWGGSASEAVLDPSCKTFKIPSVLGFIGYRNECGCAIVLGDPVCDQKDVPRLVNAFQLACNQQSKPIVYLTVSQSFADWAMQEGICSASIEFGKEVYLDPHQDPQEKTGVKASLVRRKVRHALKEGVVIHEYRDSNSELEQKIEQVGIDWLQSRRGPQVHTSHVRIFENRLGKRWFYAEHQGHVIGVLILNQLDVKNGALLNRYMVLPDSPGGVPESLVITAIKKLREEGAHFLSFGIVPSDELGKIEGLSAFSTWLGRKLFGMAVSFFRLKGHMGFWEKFQPQEEASYILFNRNHISIRELLALGRSLNMRL